MTDVHDIIHYIKSLKKGFDKDLFQSKIDELAYAVDTNGLAYDDFLTLFKIWLNLSIPVRKWLSLGICLVPSDIVEERAVEYALRWILANYENHQNVPRIAFLLGWLTAAMESESIDMTALDTGYEVFYILLTYELLTVHTLKLVYTLTKPIDVTRRRVLELISYAKIREGKKNLHRQLQVLLGLFKSYKPECVPENIPAISIHTVFKKLNEDVLKRFRTVQKQRNNLHQEMQHLLWINPINSKHGGSKKADPLVPSVEFHYQDRFLASSKQTAIPISILDFSEPVSLVHYSLHQNVMSRPTRLRSLLCNGVGQMLLAAMKQPLQVFLAHDLHHLLNNCFLEVSPYSYTEKEDLLQRLAVFQSTVAQGIPVITRFLAQYLPLWNEKDYFPELLALVEWTSVECGEHVLHIASALAKVYARAHPLEQCAILRSLTHMYNNLLYESTKPRQHFLNTLPSAASYALVLPDLAEIITAMCRKGLQVDPDDMRVLYSAIWSAQRRAIAELSHGASIGAIPAPITLGLPLLSASPVLMDNIAELMILYKLIMSSTKIMKEDHMEVLTRYMTDVLNCLYSEEILSERQEGLIFERLNLQLVAKLGYLMPDVDSMLSIRNNLAFATHTYVRIHQRQEFSDDYNRKDANQKLFHAVIDQNYTNLGRLLKTSLPELEYAEF